MALQNASNDRNLDRQGWQLLHLVQENARLSLRAIGEAIGLTPPAVAERVRRLEEAGIITGYHAEIDLAKAGLPVQAFISLTTNSQQSAHFRKAVGNMPEIIECHCVTGIESYILKVAVRNVGQLEHLLMALKDYGEVRTTVVLSIQVSRRIITAPPTENLADE